MKAERIGKIKSFLNEAKEEYISITDQAQTMENQLKVQEEHLAENMEHISDLEVQLSQANVYSAEQNEIIGNLEDELDQQMKKLIQAEERAERLLEQVLELKSSNANKNLQVSNQEVINKELQETIEHL